jgi:hypothetical protein
MIGVGKGERGGRQEGCGKVPWKEKICGRRAKEMRRIWGAEASGLTTDYTDRERIKGCCE